MWSILGKNVSASGSFSKMPHKFFHSIIVFANTLKNLGKGFFLEKPSPHSPQGFSFFFFFPHFVILKKSFVGVSAPIFCVAEWGKFVTKKMLLLTKPKDF